MKDEVVSFKIAKLLSDINDFNEDCYFGYIAEYDSSVNDYNNCMYSREYATGKDKSFTIDKCYKEYLAPTYQQLRKWLAKNKNIFYCIETYGVNNYWISRINDKLIDKTVIKPTYEETEEETVFLILSIINNFNKSIDE